MLKRREFVVRSGAAAGVAFLRYPADAAEFTYKWGHEWPASHPIAVHAVKAAQQIAQESGGQLQIRVLGAGVMGSPTAVVTQCRAGALEFAGAAFNSIEPTLPTAGLAGLPFVFADHKEAWATIDGPFGAMLRSAISKIDLHIFEKTWDGSFKQLTNNVHPIDGPDDLKGLKIRVVPAATWVSTFKTFGASPTAISANDMYTACQTHVVDGTDLPLPTFDAFKMQEVQKYISITNQGWVGYPMVANPEAWQRLPANLQQIVERAFNAAALAERSDIVGLEKALQTTLHDRGVQINPADPAPFKARIQAAGLYTQWRSQYGTDAFSALEAAVGKLT